MVSEKLTSRPERRPLNGVAFKCSDQKDEHRAGSLLSVSLSFLSSSPSCSLCHRHCSVSAESWGGFQGESLTEASRGEDAVKWFKSSHRIYVVAVQKSDGNTERWRQKVGLSGLEEMAQRDEEHPSPYRGGGVAGHNRVYGSWTLISDEPSMISQPKQSPTWSDMFVKRIPRCWD